MKTLKNKVALVTGAAQGIGAAIVARLQEANVGKQPILMRFERSAGHGAGKATRAITAEYVETYLFESGLVPALALCDDAPRPELRLHPFSWWPWG